MPEGNFDYYDDFTEGQVFEAFTTVVSEEDVAALDACSNLLSVTGPDGAELPAPSGGNREVSPFLLNSFLPMRARVRMPDGLLHAKERLELKATARIGEELETVIKVKSKYLKNNRKFIDFEHTVSRASDKAPIMIFERTIAWTN